MIVAALCALAAGALAGIFLAARHFMRQRLPVEVALAHGVGGAIGFALVLLVVVREPSFIAARQALYLLIATIGLGAFNLLFHVRGVRHRTSLIVMHALCAVSGVGTLLYGALTHESEPVTPAPSPSVSPPAPSPAPVASSPVAPGDAPSPGALAPAVASASPTSASVQTPEPTGSAELISDARLKQKLARPIGFASNGTGLLPESSTVILELARAFKDHPELELVEVQGHADERGNDGHNLWLTQERAAAVRQALVAAGVQSSRLQSAGYGASCPIEAECASATAPESCHSATRWDQDRRVTLLPLRVGGRRFKGEVVCARGVPLMPAADRAFHASP